MAARRGIPWVVSAPSGTGKTTLCRVVVARDPGIVFSVSHTTRAPRPGERDGIDYHFVTEREFRRMVESEELLEWAEYGPRGNLYGTSRAVVEGPLAEGLDVLLEIDVQGARQIRQRRPDARLLFVLPPSWEELERRLRGRGTDSPAAVEHRLTVARKELAELPLFDYAVVNDELERAVACVIEILEAERDGRPDEALARHGREAVVARRGAGLGSGT